MLFTLDIVDYMNKELKYKFILVAEVSFISRKSLDAVGVSLSMRHRKANLDATCVSAELSSRRIGHTIGDCNFQRTTLL